jgi:hypothetical protein
MSLHAQEGYRHIATEREPKRNQVVSPCGLFTLAIIWSLVGHFGRFWLSRFWLIRRTSGSGAIPEMLVR